MDNVKRDIFNNKIVIKLIETKVTLQYECCKKELASVIKIRKVNA